MGHATGFGGMTATPHGGGNGCAHAPRWSSGASIDSTSSSYGIVNWSDNTIVLHVGLAIAIDRYRS